MMKKAAKFFAVLAVSCSMIAATACGSADKGTGSANQGQTGDKQGVKEITWYLHTQYGKEYFENDVIKPFEEQHPDIKINVTYNADPEQITKSQLAAGAGPDIITTDGTTTLRQFAKAGYLVELDEYSKKYGWDQRFIPWAYPPVTVGDKLIGLPGKYETELVYYNKKMFADNGWDIPKSYDELVALSEKMTGKGIIPFAFGASDYRGANEWWLSMAYNATLGPDKLKKVLAGELPWNGADSTEAVQKLVDLWKSGYINDKKSHAITGEDATTLFLSGKAAMKMEGSWLLNTLSSKAGDMDWGIFPMPSWKEGVETNLPLALGIAYGINANSKNPDAVAEFLNYVTQPDVAAKGIVSMGLQPIKDLDVGAIPDLDKHYKEVSDLLADYGKRNATGYLSWTFWPAQTRVFSYDNLEAVFLDGMDVKSYMDKMEATYQEDKQSGKVFDFEK
ncbi:ABC transporter substrate-binding protein [Paenibacillus apiarius]|uniref:ABC transporter substrate-binding protein n=1 Tax=Paenibacillus apiarius TaxID=46240 RepID=UPI003B3A0E99